MTTPDTELAALLKRADEWEGDWSIYKASCLTLRLVKDLRAALSSSLRAATAAPEKQGRERDGAESGVGLP